MRCVRLLSATNDHMLDNELRIADLCESGLFLLSLTATDPMQIYLI